MLSTYKEAYTLTHLQGPKHVEGLLQLTRMPLAEFKAKMQEEQNKLTGVGVGGLWGRGQGTRVVDWTSQWLPCLADRLELHV